MTYKEAINRFISRYNIACLSSGVSEIKLDNKVALMLLSEVYADICNREKLITGIATVNLVSNQYEYTTGASGIPANLLDTIRVLLDDSSLSELEKVSGFSNITRISGKPRQYTILYNNSGRVLQIDSLPGGGQLIIHYFKKVFTYSGAAENTFSDLDFTKAGFGGSFLNPSEWDNVIIEGALSNLLPDRLPLFIQAKEEARRTMTVYTSSEIPSFPKSGVNVSTEAGLDTERI